eukprot:11808044-Alexandrium_andersonii.AAC.1
MFSIPVDKLPMLFESFLDLAQDQIAVDARFTPDRIAHTQTVMDRCRSAIEKHALPGVQVGFGSAGFAHKVATLMHALRL